MILIVDTVTRRARDLRAMHPDLARPLFLQALRGVRNLAHTPEGAWDAYLSGRLLPKEERIIEGALEEQLSPVPEHAQVVTLGFGHDAGDVLKTKVITVTNAEEEENALAEFWSIVDRGLAHDYQLVTYGGARWGNAFIVRRTLLRNMLPATTLPLSGRTRLAVHFDVADVLAGWDRGRVQALELAAVSYGLPGPWHDPEDPHAADTVQGIRFAVATGDLPTAEALADARLRAIYGLYLKLAGPYLADIA